MDKNAWSRRAKRAAAQSTKAYFVNGEWDDLRALNKALQASIAQQQKDGPLESDSDSEAESYSTARSTSHKVGPSLPPPPHYHKSSYDHYNDHYQTQNNSSNSHSMKNGHKTGHHKNGVAACHQNGSSSSDKNNNNIKEETTNTTKTAISSTSTSSSTTTATTVNGPARKKIPKFSNKMDNRIRRLPSKSRVVLPTLMFDNFIPEASDLFAFIKNTTIDELRSPARCLPKFPARGLLIDDYNKILQLHKLQANSGRPKLYIPKTDEELPDVFKDYYRQLRKEYLLQKSDHESEAQWSSKSSTKENGNHIDEIILDSDDDSDVAFIMEPLAPRLNAKNHQNGHHAKTAKPDKKKDLRDSPKGSPVKEERKKPGRKPKPDKVRGERRGSSVKKDTEAHKRADQFYASTDMKNRLKRAESRTVGKWAMPSPVKMTNGSHKNGGPQTVITVESEESSSSSSDDELPLPPVKKRKTISSKKRVITRSGTKRSMRKDKPRTTTF